MDSFKLTVVITLIVSVAVLGVIGVVAEESIRNSTIPDAETGVVDSKTVLTDNALAKYQINLSTGKTLYIQNDSVIYDAIVVNKTYTFDCLINYGANMLLVQHVNPQAGTVVAKAEIDDKPSVHYSVGLSNGRTLYIASNATLYEGISLNETYLFDCRVDYGSDLWLINGMTSLP